MRNLAGDLTLRIHLERLCRWEYVVAHGGGRGKLTEYELLYDGRGYEGQPTLCGLVDPATLLGTYADEPCRANTPRCRANA